MDFIMEDKTVEINAIKESYNYRNSNNKEARQKAADLWGVELNEYGFVANRQHELIYNQNNLVAAIGYITSSKGFWLMGISASTPTSGRGYTPSIWDGKSFRSYEDARLAAIYKLYDFFKQAETYALPSHIKHVRKALIHLHNEKTPQLDLFAPTPFN